MWLNTNSFSERREERGEERREARGERRKSADIVCASGLLCC